MSQRRRRQSAAALAASAGLHLLVALLVLRGVTGRHLAGTSVERPPTAIELSLIETTRRDRSAEGRRADDSPTPPARRHPPPQRPVESGGTAAPPATPSRPSERPSPVQRPVDLSFDALGDGAKQRATATPGGADALEQLLVPTPEGPALPARRKPVAELRAEADRRAEAVANVRSGRADPLLFDYLRNARDRLTPEATRIAESLPLGAAETTKGWARGYLRGVADAHSGQLAPPQAPDETVGGPSPRRTRRVRTGGPSSSVRGRATRSRSLPRCRAESCRGGDAAPIVGERRARSLGGRVLPVGGRCAPADARRSARAGLLPSHGQRLPNATAPDGGDRSRKRPHYLSLGAHDSSNGRASERRLRGEAGGPELP